MTVAKTGHRHYIYSIDFCYVKILIGVCIVLQFAEAIKILSALGGTKIVCHIYIPPTAIIINAVPRMAFRSGFARISVHYITGNVLTTTECSKQMGKVIANALLGL